MQSKPMGAARGRYAEITTKSGNTISGTLIRVDDDIVYLGFDFVVPKEGSAESDGETQRVAATVSLCDVDIFLIGDRTKRDKDSDAVEE